MKKHLGAEKSGVPVELWYMFHFEMELGLTILFRVVRAYIESGQGSTWIFNANLPSYHQGK